MIPYKQVYYAKMYRSLVKIGKVINIIKFIC